MPPSKQPPRSPRSPVPSLQLEEAPSTSCSASEIRKRETGDGGRGNGFSTQCVERRLIDNSVDRESSGRLQGANRGSCQRIKDAIHFITQPRAIDPILTHLRRIATQPRHSRPLIGPRMRPEAVGGPPHQAPWTVHSPSSTLGGPIEIPIPTEKANRPVHQLQVPGQELGQGTSRCGQDRMAPRRVVPRVGFIVTNLRWWARSVVRFYDQRGVAKQWIKEGKYALNWTRLSCHDFDDNQVRLELFILAYNLANFMRTLAPPRAISTS